MSQTTAHPDEASIGIPDQDLETARQLAMKVVCEMVESGLDQEGQAAGVLFALLAWTERWPSERQREFAKIFAHALVHRCGEAA